MTTKYMHTLDGKPAAYQEEYHQIYYTHSHSAAAPLADSLRQIRREQRLCEADRQIQFGAADEVVEYGYVKVKV